MCFRVLAQALVVLVLARLLVLNVAAAADDWRPPAPTGRDKFDWIELKSGEWLKGKIKSMQDEKLEFDSEELDLHSFEWKDIRTVRSPRFLSVRFDAKNEVELEGSLLVTTNRRPRRARRTSRSTRSIRGSSRFRTRRS